MDKFRQFPYGNGIFFSSALSIRPLEHFDKKIAYVSPVRTLYLRFITVV